MPEPRVLGLGLVGCGNVAVNRHLPVLQSLKDAKVVALADTNKELLNRTADRFRVEARYGDFRALLDNPQVEAVAICTPPQAHVEIALAALEAGKHLFIEKPLALSLDDCDRLVEHAARSPNKVMLGFKLRWHHLIRRARDILQRGDLGNPKAIRYLISGQYKGNEAEWLKSRESGGGMLIEESVHTFDLWRFLLQSEIEEVFALSHSGQWEDETAAVTARMANGVLATAVLSKGTAENHEVEIYGQNGRLLVSRYRFDGLELHPASNFPGSLETRMNNALYALKSLPRAVRTVRAGGAHMNTYCTQWRHFIAAVQHDAPVESTLEDGRRSLQAVLATVASASWGRPVQISQAPRRVTPVPSGD